MFLQGRAGDAVNIAIRFRVEQRAEEKQGAAGQQRKGLPQAQLQFYIAAMLPTEFKGVTAVTKANIYFEGKVISHTLLFPDQSKKTLGLIYAGQFHFGTDKPERMEIVAGQCTVKLDGQSATRTYRAGDTFEVPGKSGFDIAVESGICEYICSFL
jgi:uncharacterized protein YaiE (UPF0345 family)